MNAKTNRGMHSLCCEPCKVQNPESGEGVEGYSSARQSLPAPSPLGPRSLDPLIAVIGRPALSVRPRRAGPRRRPPPSVVRPLGRERQKGRRRSHLPRSQEPLKCHAGPSFVAPTARKNENRGAAGTAGGNPRPALTFQEG